MITFDKKIGFGLLLIAFSCKSKNETLIQEQLKSDSYTIYYDSVTGKKYASIDTFYYFLDDSLIGTVFE